MIHMPQYRWIRDLSAECFQIYGGSENIVESLPERLRFVAILTFMNNHIYLRYKPFREVTYET